MMTVDEARTCLGLGRDAGVQEIREAFRMRAREVHPDRHPDADPYGRRRLELEFDRARTARDILVTHVGDTGRMPAPAATAASSPAETSSRRAYRESRTAEPRPSTRTRPRTAAPPRTAPPPRTEAPPRVTLRFDEFVQWTDALGFSTGRVAPRPIDWTRIAVWSITGAAVLVVATEALWVPLAR
ncbi:DnaJ domain-containing protein [Microbacterium sp.]|uniref:DnaJ domain-containing protein n=1 Tax=Microbacterium sp. TaxID=51671 RepID=UPI000927345D|nr:DnaJ domain-containing protein [Microbacterium sp.]MBN9187417.1 DnaJ domain-containing protein [Microbacterium sp.]OJU57137.1 MAG: hypothetical protein BGO04_03950 [Microbacterium sp. 70-38]